MSGYVPHLLRRADHVFRKVRELPIPGRSLVRVGQKVEPTTPVLRAELPGDLHIVRASDELGFEPDVVSKHLKLAIGQRVEKGELLCRITYFFGLFNQELRSPVSGTVEFFIQTTAHLGIREPQIPLTIEAYVPGLVTNDEPGQRIEIEGFGVFVQGVFGVGGERQGILRVLNISCDQPITEQSLRDCDFSLEDAILLGGSTITDDALRYSAESRVKGVVTGSISSKQLEGFVGYEIGVSMTGDEPVSLTLVITEGFGRRSMAGYIKELVLEYDGQRACLNGATQVRAGAIRPELIIPRVDRESSDRANSNEITFSERGDLSVGGLIRGTRDPYFGMIGRVISLPTEPLVIGSGARVRCVEVEFPGGERHFIPRANVEIA